LGEPRVDVVDRRVDRGHELPVRLLEEDGLPRQVARRADQERRGEGRRGFEGQYFDPDAPTSEPAAPTIRRLHHRSWQIHIFYCAACVCIDVTRSRLAREAARGRSMWRGGGL